MKVLLVNSTFGGVSGSGQHVKMIVEELGGKVDFELWNVNSIGYLNFPKLRSISFYMLCKLKNVPKDVDIVHVHNPKFSGLFQDSFKNMLTIHGDYKVELLKEYGYLAKPIIAYINSQIRRADLITTVSPLWAKLNDWLWVPNMIKLSEVTKIEPYPDGGYLLFVGRDDPIKDYPLFKEIAYLVYKRYAIKSVALGLLKKDEEYLRHMKVPRSEVIARMKSALALVVTSRHEGFPTVILEAWASHCPVIARNILPLRVLEKLYPGSLLLFNNADDFIRIIEKFHEVKNHLIKAGWNAVKNFDAKIVCEKYYKLYKRLLNSY